MRVVQYIPRVAALDELREVAELSLLKKCGSFREDILSFFLCFLFSFLLGPNKGTMARKCKTE
jgi:hypothetical protein